MHDNEHNLCCWPGLRNHQPRHEVNDTHHGVIPAPLGENGNPNKLCIMQSLLRLLFSVDKQFGSFHVASSDLNKGHTSFEHHPKP